MANAATHEAVRIHQDDYRQYGCPPGKYVDTGTHLARFEALERLHWACLSYRSFKATAARHQLNHMRAEIRQMRRILRTAAVPIIPG
jgi:hypothetical protein